MDSNRFFIALLPAQEIRDEARKIQQYFADKYNSRAVFKSPPHITLQPPFARSPSEEAALHSCLEEFGAYYSPFAVKLSGFAAFAPRVIYIHVVKVPALMALQAHLMTFLEAQLGISDPASRERGYTPHLTVAFRDLTKQNFKAAWPEFKTRPWEAEFIASELTLLRHDGSQWQAIAHFPLTGAATTQQA